VREVKEKLRAGNLTTIQLRDVLREFGAKVHGNKAELVGRLEEILEDKHDANRIESLSFRERTSADMVAADVVAADGVAADVVAADVVVADMVSADVVATEVTFANIASAEKMCHKGTVGEKISAQQENDRVNAVLVGVRDTKLVRSPVPSMVSSSSCRSNRSVSSTASRRQEAIVRNVKNKALAEKRREAVQLEVATAMEIKTLEAKKKLLEIEIDETEAEVEVEAWRKLEELEDEECDAVIQVADARGSRDIMEKITRAIVPKEKSATTASGVDHEASSSTCMESVHLSRDESLRQRVCPSARMVSPVADLPTTREKAFSQILMSSERGRLPGRQIEEFDGRLEKYFLFKTAFNSVIAGCGLSDEEKLHYLYQYTKGKPRQIVEACLYMKSKLGYAKAWILLDRRYGNPEAVGSSYLDILLNRPIIARDDTKALDDYALALNMTENAVSEIAYGKAELENPKTIRLLLSKLPLHLQDRWRRLATEAVLKGKQASYRNFVDFVDHEALIAGNPLYGRDVMTAAQNNGREASSRRVIIGTLKESIPCLFCADNHDIRACAKFSERSHGEKIEFLKKQSRCFMCFALGHGARTCSSPVRCDICNRWHPTVLHRGNNEGGGVRAVVFEGTSGSGSFHGDRENLRSLGGREGHTGGTSRLGSGPVDSERGSGSRRGVLAEQRDWGVRSQSAEAEFQLNTHAQPFEPADGVSHSLVMRVGAGSLSGGKMQIIPVEVSTDWGVLRTGALIDSGSAITICTNSLLGKLGKLGEDAPTTSLRVSTVAGETDMVGRCVCELRIRGVAGGDYVELPPVYAVEEIPVTKFDGVTQADLSKWAHLEGVDIGVVSSVELILGANVPAAFEPIEVVPAPRTGEPFAVMTRLGWVAAGFRQGSVGHFPVGRMGVDDTFLSDLVRKAFNEGFVDIGSVGKGLSEDDRTWLSIVETGCKWDGSKFVVPLPLKCRSNTIVPQSMGQAFRRVMSLGKKLGRDGHLKNMYCTAMSDMFDKGYAERVCAVHEDSGDRSWFIPHFHVSSPNKPDKVRIVFDCAAKNANVSLNDLLYSGPHVGNDLVDVLLKFRAGRFAYMGDIESMYYQVRVPEADRNWLKFLWWDDINNPTSLAVYRMTVHLFGACSSPSIATYVLRKVAREGEDISQLARATVSDNFYVDDCLKSLDFVTQLRDNLVEVSLLCCRGGFKLGKFVGSVDFDGIIAKGGQSKALGVRWDADRDVIGPTGVIEEIPTTRRMLLSAIASIYDPLGIVSPTMMRGRELLQISLRKDSAGWDDEFAPDLMYKVNAWVSSAKLALKTTIPRWIFCSLDMISAELHVFADASSIGHGAVAYLRCSLDGYVTCSFLTGKSRVNPLKAVSIPRMELQAAVLATELSLKLSAAYEFRIRRVCMWSDSTVVLAYLRNNENRYSIFVSNRVEVIKERTSVEQWRYVDGLSNPADESSRGRLTSRWIEGPDFLLREENYWPREPQEQQELDLEVKTTAVMLSCTQEGPTDKLLNYYSDWNRLLRAVAWWRRLAMVLKRKDPKSLQNLTVQEIVDAERSVLKYVQHTYYNQEINMLMTEGRILRNSSLNKLDVFVSDELLRVGGRLGKACVSETARHPVVLPAAHNVVTLIVMHTHEKLGHLGTSIVLGSVREHYWIVKGQSSVRGVLRKCITCKKVQGCTAQQKMADLPIERVTAGNPPFSCSGVDCFGPFEIKTGRRREKRYGVVFTCLAMRAIHIEVLEDMTADAMIGAIRRFTARGGEIR